MKKAIRIALALIAAALLVACGGSQSPIAPGAMLRALVQLSATLATTNPGLA